METSILICLTSVVVIVCIGIVYLAYLCMKNMESGELRVTVTVLAGIGLFLCLAGYVSILEIYALNRGSSQPAEISDSTESNYHEFQDGQSQIGG